MRSTHVALPTPGTVKSTWHASDLPPRYLDASDSFASASPRPAPNLTAWSVALEARLLVASVVGKLRI
jgi:hypothetical protein